MPELTVPRTPTAPPPMACMYCGAPATTTVEWQEPNRTAHGCGGGTDLTPVPAGDDPVSAAVGVLMLPLVLWDLAKGLVAAVGYLTRPRPATPAAVLPREPHTTRVVVTACDKHRRYRSRFVWAGLAMSVILVLLWAWAVVVTRRAMGTENVGPATALLTTAIFATVLLPLALSVWYVFAGPVIVDRVTEDAVVLDRVRQAYFDATGLRPVAPASNG